MIGQRHFAGVAYERLPTFDSGVDDVCDQNELLVSKSMDYVTS